MRGSLGQRLLLSAAVCIAFATWTQAQTSVLFWCESSNTNRLNLAVTKIGNKYYLNDISGYATNTSKVKNYYLDWDLLGTPSQPKAVTNIEVEPGQLHLVNLDMVNLGRTINDYWDANAGRERVVAWVWVGGSPQAQTNISPQISEIHESGSWFYFEQGKRLPAFSQRFPAFTLPSNKFLHIQKYATRDTDAGYESHGVDKSGICLSVNFFRDPLGDDTNGANEALHISATEAGFLGCSWSFLTGMAGVGQQYDHIIMDQEWWHNDYQTGTIARLCFFMNECKRLNPAVRISDWWAGKPYDRGIFKPVEGNRPVIDPMWVAQDYNPATATANGDATFLTPVNANGVTTTLAEAENAVSINAYPNAIFSHDYIANRPDINNYDFEIYNVIHHTRVNKRMSVNTGKPHIWFCSLLQFSGMNEPLVPYSTRTTSPPGTFTFAEDLMVAPSACEAWGFFSMFEGDGAYLWDDGAFYGGEDPNGVFKKAQYCINFNDNRGIWTPDVPGTPIGTTGAATNGYPSYHTYQPDYLALGVWKYTAIADIVTNGIKVDFQYSTNNGATWYIPPTNGSTMCEVASNLGVIVVGAVSTSLNQIAIAAFNPFQSVTSTVHVIARYAGTNYGFDVVGKRVRVFRGGLATPILIPPVITHTPVSVIETAPPFVITAGATDDVQIASAVLWWNRNGGAWTSTVMAVEAGIITGTFTPPVITNLDQFQYRIDVVDDQGLVATNGPHSFIYSSNPTGAYVHSGTSWRYLATNTAPLTTWKNVGFDDSLWPTGTTPMGYGGDVDIVTPLSYGPQTTNKYPTTYFRTTFSASNVTALLALNVYARVDDGMVIHLNGTEVQRINMPGGAISHTNFAASAASNAPRPWQVFAINPSLVANGQNTLAVEVHQASAGSSDLYFDLQLQPSQLYNWPIPVTPNKLYSVQTNAPAWTVTAQTTNSNQVASMLLRWNRNGGAWSNVPMSGTGGVFSASLAPGAFEDEDQFGYEIRTTSLLGVSTTNGPFGVMYLIPKGADLFPAESTWKYIVTNSAPDSTWKTNGFNDTAWPTGNAPFGYGGADDKATVLDYGPSDTNKYITTYFRKTFTTTNPGSITALRAYMRVDDGIVVYVNGNEALRDTMPGGAVTYSTLANGGAIDPPRVWEIDSINPLMLVTGLNTIAVELHQAGPGSSDTFFDLFLQPESGTTITHTPLASVQTSTAPWTVSALVNSYLPLTAVTLFYGENFGSMAAYPMTSSVPGTYVAAINPIDLADRDQFQYRIEAVDTLNATSSYGTIGFIYVAQEAASLIPAGSSDWKYLAQPTSPDPSWSAPSFDDSAWSQGSAPLGIGTDEKINTVVDYGPDPNNKYTTYYFRKTFTLGEAWAVRDMRTFFRIDDGMVVYLNGQPWSRINMPTSLITYSTLATSNAANPPRPWQYMSMNEEMLVDGTNTIAVEIHQVSLTSSDLSFDMHMYPEYRPALTHTVLPSFTTSQPPWQVSANIESFYPLTSVKLWWTRVGGTWTNVTMTGSGTYTAMIAPSSVADHDHFQYRIDAMDSQGQAITNGPWGFMYVAPPTLPLVSPGSGWKYLVTNSGPTSAWKSVNYNDTNWGVGIAAFGFGGNEVYGTVLGYGPDSANKYPTYYFRRTFTLTGTVALATLKSYFQADDGIVVYINGQEAGRTNLPTGPIAYTNYALGSSPNEPRPWQTLPFNPALVATGINTIAIELHQSSPGSSDLFLDFLLYGSTIVSTDQDSDGMPDVWEQSYFGGSTNGMANADPDGDRISNLGEYISGTDPNSSTSRPQIRISGNTNAPILLGIQTASNRLYRIDYSTNLLPTTWNLFTNINGDGSYMTFPSATNSTRKGWYYRFRARLP